MNPIPSLPPEPPERGREKRGAETPLVIPSVAGCSLLDAGLAYAEAGLFILPVRRGSKSPGSLVGNGWENFSSRDCAQIRKWAADPRVDGWAWHVGRNGATAFDVDKVTDLRLMAANGHGDIMDALLSASAIQTSRPGTDRGHYVFANNGERYGNQPGLFGRYGEVRGTNGVILLAPTPHRDGGEYAWTKMGQLTPVPEVLQECLCPPSDTAKAMLLDGDAAKWVDAQPGANLEPDELAELPEREWLSEYATPDAVRELLLAGGGSVYEAARDKAKHIVFAGQEGRKGLVLALNNLGDAYLGIMADRQAGLLAGEVRGRAAAEAELRRAVAGAVALAVRRGERYDTTAWQERLAEKLRADDTAGEDADRAARIAQRADRIEEEAEARRLVAERNAVRLIDARSDSFKDGWAFLTEGSNSQPVWGEGDRVLWATGEGLMIVGPQGVGKSTVVQQLVLSRLGLRGDFCGYPVAVDERPVLYLAMDRPSQIARSMRRMIDPATDREVIRDRLIIWSGPPPFSADEAPKAFAEWVVKYGRNPGTLVIDSVKDLCSGLTGDENGMGFNAAIQAVIAAGVDVVSNHHQRKANADNKKPDKLADVYGSNWITAGQGSVLLLWGEPGASSVELSHLKQPMERMPPLIINHQRASGESAASDPLELLVELATIAGADGITEAECVRALFDVGKGDDGYENYKKTVRRRLDKLTDAKRFAYTAGSRGGSGGGGNPARWSINTEWAG